MEFGCCAYEGADAKGPAGWNIINWDKDIPEVKEEYSRNEDVQANYIKELLDIFEAEEVFASFVFTFVTYNYIHHSEPKYDLDLGSFGIVKALPPEVPGYAPALHWLPKKAFYELADYNKRHEANL
jgi:hypothetical protein